MSQPREPIRSASHPLLKRVRAAAMGRAPGEILLEGDRLVDEARRQGMPIEVVLVAEERTERLDELLSAGVPARPVTTALLAGVSSLQTSPGCLALAPEPRSRTMIGLAEREDALLVIAAGIQDPGNLGALARTAEAAGASGLLVTAGGCRPWNPKVLRGSMGSVLRLAVVEVEASAAPVRELTRRGFRHVSARTRGGRSWDAFDWRGRVALWFSSEGGGFPPELACAAEGFEGVTIPMAGGVESLNVTAAAAVLLFAAQRTEARA